MGREGVVIRAAPTEGGPAPSESARLSSIFPYFYSLFGTDRPPQPAHTCLSFPDVT